MFRKKNSLLRFCSIITILFFFCVIDSGAQVRKTPTVIDKSKVTDIKQAEVNKNAAQKVEPVKSGAPVITKHPENVNATSSTVTFTVTATGDPALSYVWMVCSPTNDPANNISWSPIDALVVNSKHYPAVTGQYTNKLILTQGNNQLMNMWDGYRFRCLVQNKNTNGTFQTVYSNYATLKIVAPTITSQPQSVTVSAGSTATFSITAQGEGLTYRWENASPGKTDWSEAKNTNFYSGSQTNKLTLKTQYKDADGYTVTMKSGTKFRCRVWNDFAPTVTSNEVTLTLGSSSATQPKTGTTKTNFGLTVSGGTVTWKSNFAELPFGAKITTIKNVSGSPIAIQESNGKNLVRLNNNANTGDTFKGREALSLTLYCVSGAPMYDASNPNQTKTGPAIEVSWTME